MASAQSSQDMRRGRGRQPQTLGNAQPRHRSESRRLSDRQRQVKTTARKRDYCPGALQEGDAIRVFSRQAAVWMDGEVVKFFEGNFVRVEYEVDEYRHGKTLHLHSEHLDIPKALPASPNGSSLTSSAEEHDPDLAIRVPQDPIQKEFPDPHVPAALEKVLADASEVTDEMKMLQRTDPTRCAMTLEQWNLFINSCKDEPLWQEIKDEKKFVSIYDVNEAFVKPWTRGKGCGVALLMNKATSGKEAEVMLSHSWAEDAEECQNALNLAAKDGHIEDTSAVWFCTFAQYQVEDGAGPSISEQLKEKPFQKVITSVHVKKMLAIHTLRSNLYTRLWCVHEVDKAIEEGKETLAAFSTEYAKDIEQKYNMVIRYGGLDADAMDRAGITVRSGHAECSRPEDTEMLLKEVLSKKGGFQRIDERVSEFRRQHVYEFIQKSLRESPKAIIAYVSQSPLEGVEMLFNIAANGDARQQDELFDQKLEPWASRHMEKVVQKGFDWYEDGKGFVENQRDDVFCKSCVDRLLFKLLLAMAKTGHTRAIQTMKNWQGCDPLGQKDHHDVAMRQRSFQDLQILAKEGYTSAIDELLKKWTNKRTSDAAQRAFESLVWEWNQLTLKELQSIEDKELGCTDQEKESVKTQIAKMLEKFVKHPLRSKMWVAA